MNKIKAVFFDWGGVVADDPGDDFLRKLLLDIGASDEQIITISRDFMKPFMKGKISEQEYWKSIANKYGLTIPSSISDEFMKWSGLLANQDILNLITEIKQKDIKVAVLSNVIEPTYNTLKKSGFYDLFDETIASFKEGYAKPDKEIYNIALKKLNVSAINSLFIDDKEKNLIPAQNLGINIIQAKNPQQIITDIRKVLEY